jgi:hypothetical protein
MKRLIGTMIFFMLAVPALCLEAADHPDKAVRLGLTIRTPGQTAGTDRLKKENMRLLIDNQPRPILEVVEKTVSMAAPPGFPGRNFILSFHMAGYGKQVKEAVFYFIYEALTPADSLLLLTPLKAYTVTVSANKTRTAEEIDNLLTQDCGTYKTRRYASQKKLDSQLNRMKRLFTGQLEDKARIASYKMIGMFLGGFPLEFQDFRNRYLFPNVDKYRQVAALLGNREGQRWWVHFLEGDSSRITARAQWTARQIDRYCNLYPLARQSFSNNLRRLEELLRIPDAFPAGPLSDIFIHGDIRFNTLVYDSLKGKTDHGQADMNSRLAGVLNQVSIETGGKTIYTVDLEKGIKDIIEHRDRFYRLFYHFNGTIGEKSIEIIPGPPGENPHRKIKLAYPKYFSENDIRSLVRGLSSETVKITDFSLSQRNNKPVARFVIKSIAFNEEKKFGLVKARIQLFDERGDRVYRTENTLRSSRREISLSVPIPGRFRGAFKLMIEAYDLISNRLASFDSQVHLN